LTRLEQVAQLVATCHQLARDAMQSETNSMDIYRATLDKLLNSYSIEYRQLELDSLLVALLSPIVSIINYTLFMYLLNQLAFWMKLSNGAVTCVPVLIQQLVGVLRQLLLPLKINKLVYYNILMYQHLHKPIIWL
jgi:hypothetical protein